MNHQGEIARSLQEIRGVMGRGDAWSRIDPESVPPVTQEPERPLTTGELILYSLLTPPICWWASGSDPSSTRWGAVNRFFFFRLGMPPRGLLDLRQFALFLAVGVGVPAVIVVAVAGMVAPILAAFAAVLFISWALILYGVYFSSEKW